jgi:hypothetical protein
MLYPLRFKTLERYLIKTFTSLHEDEHGVSSFVPQKEMLWDYVKTSSWMHKHFHQLKRFTIDLSSYTMGKHRASIRTNCSSRVTANTSIAAKVVRRQMLHQLLQSWILSQRPSLWYRTDLLLFYANYWEGSPMLLLCLRDTRLTLSLLSYIQDNS